MIWLNEPTQWSESDASLEISPNEGSDFWRITDYGFIHDNGHARLEPVDGDFTASVEITANYREQYDQAGVMIRVDAENWLKTGIEFVDGRCFLSAVVTRGFSDWSVVPLDRCPETLGVRVRRRRDSITIETSTDREPFQILRVTYLPAGSGSGVGPTCCAPTKAGFTAKFTEFNVEKA
jgi:regulation of enolase protein 1 (concanavalin A-like superfamily)